MLPFTVTHIPYATSPAFPFPLATSDLSPFPKCSLSRTLYKWIPIVCDLWNWLFHRHNAFEIHSSCCVYQQFISSYCCVVFPDTDTLSVCNYSPILGHFHYYKRNLCEQSCTDCVWTNDQVFISMAQCPGVPPPGHLWCVYISCQAVDVFSRTACAILLSTRKAEEILFIYIQHSVSLLFFLIAIPVRSDVSLWLHLHFPND